MMVSPHRYDYDLIVIGGGSGGLATAKKAAEHLPANRVCVLDYIVPSPLGSTWGLGGTCVNVGCIPKKLMHTASIHHENNHVARNFGINSENVSVNWETLRSNVQAHVKKINKGQESSLRSENVVYENALGTFTDPHTVALNYGPGNEGANKSITAAKIVVAVGGRPNTLAIPGGEHCLTSDDIFQKEASPGKICVVGAGYVALEIAGFMVGLGFDVTILVRSMLLRGFDREVVDRIQTYMTRHGTKFVVGVNPTKIEQNGAKFAVSYGPTDGPETTEEFDTVLQGIGRSPVTGGLGLEAVGVEMDRKGQIITDKFECTNVSHIYAIGDVCVDKPELTPVAVQAGKMLADRLFSNSVFLMDYDTIATTVFTPIEYGAIGFSEEDAEKQFPGDCEVYINEFAPLEWTLDELDPAKQAAWLEDQTASFVKVICVKSQDERIVGFHYVGPNAAEVTQGFSLAMRLGATKQDLDMTVGIHPSCAEMLTTLKITKSSGIALKKEGVAADEVCAT